MKPQPRNTRLGKHTIVTRSAAVAAGLWIAGAASQAATLLNQWNFNETSGTTAANAVGGGPGATLMGNATFDGSGGVTLNGTAGTYINLGGNLLNTTSVTFEGWFSYTVGNNNVHLFSFDDGTGKGTENGGSWNGNYIRYNVYDSNHAGGVSWVEIPNLGNPNGGVLNGTSVLPQNQLLHTVVVYDPANSVESLYINGALQSTVTGTLAPVSSIKDTRGTLGASPWSAWGDPFIVGTINQFSIYDGALTEPEVAARFAAGPVAVPEPSSAILASAACVLFGLGIRRR